MRTTTFRPAVTRTSNEWATSFEANVLRQGHGAICVHNFTIGIDRRDRTIDRNAVQVARQKACRDAQEAALAADPLNAKDPPNGLLDS